MKLKIALSTATAMGLAMGAAWAGSGNKAYTVQQGGDNQISVDQDGDWNVAGKRLTYTEYLGQVGDHNKITVNQDGNWNRIANTGPGSAGAIQNNDRNVLTVDQTSSATVGDPLAPGENGNIIDRVRQTGTIGATATTNSATITQQIGPNAGSVIAQGLQAVASHYVGSVTQTFTGANGAAANDLHITQTGAYSKWFGGGQGNRVDTVKQNGSGNQITTTQDGIGPVLTTSGQQQRGPANIIKTIDQTGAGNEATVTQNGFQNYVASVTQGGIGDNTATLHLNGDYNGATPPAPGVWSHSAYQSIGLFTSGRGAEAAGAGASAVSQSGSNNSVDYTATGNSNQFGFYQLGVDNKTNGIVINGSNNELGVWQSGTNNSLTLATINDSDNVFGLKQSGLDNTANISASGGKNGGYAGFTAGPASGLGLTAGLLEQSGTFNQVSLTISGGQNNVFASLQDNSGPGPSTWNKITATQSGSDNQAAVAQVGNQNTTTLTQNGGMNNASISQ